MSMSISTMKSFKSESQNQAVEDFDDREYVSSPFVEGEKVLAYHGPLIYTAKVQKVMLKDDQWIYFLHYSGWSKNWDEWVGDDRLLKFNDANLAEQQRLNAEKNAKTSSKAKSTQQNSKSSDSKPDKDEKCDLKTTGKKRKSDLVFEENETGAPSQLSIPLSKQIRDHLIFDFSQISKGMLLPLPRKPNVSEILDQFVIEYSTPDSSERDCVLEMVLGLKSYFDHALPLLLLYKQERGQYLSFSGEPSSQKLPSKIYGAEHLLRLFTELPELFNYVKLEEETKTILTQKLLEFLNYLQKNQSSFFLKSYEVLP